MSTNTAKKQGLRYDADFAAVPVFVAEGCMDMGYAPRESWVGCLAAWVNCKCVFFCYSMIWLHPFTPTQPRKHMHVHLASNLREKKSSKKRKSLR